MGAIFRTIGSGFNSGLDSPRAFYNDTRVWYLLLLLFLIQLPFCYDLYRSFHLSRYLAAIPIPQETDEVPFHDIRGGIHVHSAAGGHSLGTYTEIIAAAKEADYHYLFITEHTRPHPLFAPIADPDLVVIYGQEKEWKNSLRTLIDPRNQVRILTDFHEEAIPSAVNGMEIINLHQSAAGKNRWYQGVNFLYHRLLFSELFHFHLWSPETIQFKAWDREMQRRPITGIAGNDAHQNVGIVLQTTSGHKLFSLMVDPYVESFRFLTTHLFLSPGAAVTERSVLNALKHGRAYMTLERIADPTGFSFHAQEGARARPIGSAVGKGAVLVTQSPIPVRILLLKDGHSYRELEGRKLVIRIKESGAYRVVLYPLHPPSLLKDTPWIISNPIFAR